MCTTPFGFGVTAVDVGARHPAIAANPAMSRLGMERLLENLDRVIGSR
jgi:hypothetical protein